jgi:hypothetical protein
MGVYIKGMRMPENCIKCPLQFGGWCYVSPPEIDERVAPTVDEAVERGKPEWCPIVDLGKHGDLIDRDALKETLDYYIREAGWGEEINKALGWVKDDFINSEPIVIEAEGTDEGSN